MTKTKISRFKISGIFAMSALLVCFVVAATFISVNAFATDEEYAGEQPNPTTQKILFNISGLEDGVSPQFSLTDKKKPVDYKLGDKIEVDNGANVMYSPQAPNYLITIKDSNHDYLFLITTPLGYEFDKCSTSVEKITADTDFILNYKPTSEPYNLKVFVSADGAGCKGAWVKFYYPDSQTYIIGTAQGDKGVCEFTNLEASKATGILIAGFDGYAYSVAQVTSKNYRDHSGNANLSLNSIDKANVLLNDPGEHHKTFEINVRLTVGGVVQADMKMQNETFYFVATPSVEGTWLVEPDGTLNYTVEQGSAISSMFLKPLAEEGYSLTKWKLDRGNNAAEYYEPGQSFTIGEGEKLNVVPIYGTAPTPGPEPTPTPTEEVTAQTGDSAPLVPFVLLAVLAGGVLLYTRKASQK